MAICDMILRRVGMAQLANFFDGLVSIVIDESFQWKKKKQREQRSRDEQ